MTIHPLTLFLLPETFAICRLAPGTPLPDWVQTNAFFSLTNTSEEVSLVCPQESLPSDVNADRDWRCFKLQGPIPFSLTGILNSITAPLAQASLGIFAISTYDTDYVLVKQEVVPQALSALTDAGHTIHSRSISE
jgi:uncharacterized protein